MKKPQKFFMAVDQYGNTFHNLKHPRKDLCEKLGRQHVDRMYVDTKDGKSYHCGYIIGGHWLDVFEVIPMRKPIIRK